MDKKTPFKGKQEIFFQPQVCTIAATGSKQPSSGIVTAMFNNPDFGAHTRLLGMVVLWGAAWPFGKVVAQSMPPLGASGVRFALAATVLLACMHFFYGNLQQLRHWSLQRWLGMALAGAVGVFGYAAFFLSGLQHLPASKATLLIVLSPPLTLLLAAWLFKEKLNRTIVLGMALAVTGAIIVITHGNPLALLRGTALGRGEWLILGCVACWVAYTLMGRKVLAGVDSLAITAVTSALGAVMLLASSMVFEGPQGVQRMLEAGPYPWFALVFLALGSTALAYAWFFSGMKALGAGAASGYITLVPVVGVIASALLLREEIEASTIIGGLVAVTGTALMNRGHRPQANKG